ncbi:cryptochrome/photolyase family protein [Polaromonas sp.]|uniref:cryptochrome/photolyase family protein n=1 Tax=Polaromonas sp. TaxID=1869339 RepID=UPI002488984A|nr:cryptochrome/photolyase family protein [Polaromonas sp.]MDI1340088.1 cryptochrome/photolyase family protein [Polaromonas sp.]
MPSAPCRHLILILGDQLDGDSAAFDNLDPTRDVVLMIEAREESTHVWSHKARTVLFLSAMRHFADTLRQRGWRVAYRALDAEGDLTLADGLRAAVARYRPERVMGVEPGDLRVRRQMDEALESLVNPSAATAAEQPASFTERLPDFGKHQDAMWTGLDFGWHALLSSSLNLKLLNPLEVVLAAENAYRTRHLDLASVEGFIRQVLGWREFIRGVYFLDMPGLKTANHFGHDRPLPAWYWTGATHMNCMRQCISQTLANGYSHHIQRLMVTGMFGVTAQISPQQLCDWYLAVYVDAVEWVELPNTAGMALFANGGRFTSKPYVASGAYVKRMSNYCSGCRYEPETRTGPNACPMTTLYWNFLDRHETAFAANPRTALMIKHLQGMAPQDRQLLRAQAQDMLAGLDQL